MWHNKHLCLKAVVISFLFSLSGCTKKLLSETKPSNRPITYKARVAENWHHYFTKKLYEDDEITEGWALFSYGGWANDGQIMVFRRNKDLLVEIAGIGLPTESSNELLKKQLKNDMPDMSQFAKLGHIEESVFDSLNFEYLHIEKNTSKVEHVFMRAADLKKYPKHMKLISKMQKFRN